MNDPICAVCTSRPGVYPILGGSRRCENCYQGEPLSLAFLARLENLSDAPRASRNTEGGQDA